MRVLVLALTVATIAVVAASGWHRPPVLPARGSAPAAQVRSAALTRVAVAVTISPRPSPSPSVTPSPGINLPGAPFPSPSPSSPSGGGGGPGIFDIPGQIQQAINSWFAGVVKAVLNPVLALLGRTVLATPDIPGQLRTSQLWTAMVIILNTLYVLFILTGAVPIMTARPPEMPDSTAAS